MRMDRNWIALALAATMLTAIGCQPKTPDVEPPPVETKPTPPPTEVKEPVKPAPIQDATEKKPPESIQQLQERLETQGLIGDVFFDFNKYDLAADAKERLAKNAEFMKSAEGSQLTFKLEGHCDERGTNEYNYALGDNRSNAVRDYLGSLGVDVSNVTATSLGEERPFCTESTEACWAKNRRARFVVTGRN